MVNVAGAVGYRLSPLRPRFERLARRRSRRSFIRRVRFAAAWSRATVDLQVGHDVLISRKVRVTFKSGSINVLHVAEGTTMSPGVQIQLKGGEVRLGPRVDLRHNVVLNISGRLELVGDNPVSWGSVIHCSNAVTLQAMAGVAERVTIADSSHFFTEPDQWFYHNVKLGKVDVGTNTWLCPNSVLTRFAQVGDHCIVAAGSVVIGTVPSGHLASGVPATATKLDLPWETPSPAPRRKGARQGAAQ